MDNEPAFPTVFLSLCLAAFTSSTFAADPLRALLIAGGCCHDYATQNDLLKNGPQRPIEISFAETDHPVTQGLEGWTTGNEELYNNVKVFESIQVLAHGKQETRRRVEEAVVAWANDYHGTRVFSTTLGHNNALVGDERYLDLLARGLLWACHKLEESLLSACFEKLRPRWERGFYPGGRKRSGLLGGQLFLDGLHHIRGVWFRSG